MPTRIDSRNYAGPIQGPAARLWASHRASFRLSRLGSGPPRDAVPL